MTDTIPGNLTSLIENPYRSKLMQAKKKYLRVESPEITSLPRSDSKSTSRTWKVKAK